MINLGKLSYGSCWGAHAWYCHIGGSLGVKVFNPDTTTLADVQREYIITKYLEPSGVTTEALAHGTVAAVHPHTGRRRKLSCIWMRHYTGRTLQDHLDFMDVSYESDAFESWRIRHDAIIQMLYATYGVALVDHRDNLHNIIVEDNALRLIDFSIEDMPRALRVKMHAAAKPFMHVTLPPKPDLLLLQKLGFVLSS